MTGIGGLLSGPIGFNVSRAVHGSASTTLGLGPAPTGVLSPLTLGLVKGVEYGLLGFGLAWLMRRGPVGPGACAALGSTIGLVFGALILSLQIAGPPTPTPVLVANAVNEIVFPVGCAYAAHAAGAQLGRG